MSEENSITLVHESYIDEKSIDESTMPSEITERISKLDSEMDAYFDSDEEANDQKEKAFEDESKLIKAAIISWENNRVVENPPVVDVPPVVTPNPVIDTPPVSSTEPKKEQPKKEEKKGSGIPFLDMLGLD